ncbi:MAG: NAD(P)-dependent oxidoreductase [Acidiferrobacterales bacterium]|nr:NAD(P)-dependent oxidoreductase [Acidiferrobacterales bacterium]
MTQFSEVAVIGLGAIGWGAALSLIEEGFTVYGVDINPEKLEQFREEKGKPCATAAEAMENANVCIVYVVDDAQTERVLFGESGAIAQARPGSLFILSSTMPPSSTTHISEKLVTAGMLVLDAPVSGGPAIAMRGELAVLVSGNSDALEMADPVFHAISSRVHYLGEEPGQASKIKMLNQMLTDIHVAATAEAMTMAQAIGVDLGAMYKVINNSTGGSWVFDVRGEKLMQKDFKPRAPINNVTKDLGIADREARSAGLNLPLTSAAYELFSRASASGLGQEDSIAVAKLLTPADDQD